MSYPNNYFYTSYASNESYFNTNPNYPSYHYNSNNFNLTPQSQNNSYNYYYNQKANFSFTSTLDSSFSNNSYQNSSFNNSSYYPNYSYQTPITPVTSHSNFYLNMSSPSTSSSSNYSTNSNTETKNLYQQEAKNAKEMLKSKKIVVILNNLIKYLKIQQNPEKQRKQNQIN